jgi:hypothetical protein
MYTVSRPRCNSYSRIALSRVAPSADALFVHGLTSPSTEWGINEVRCCSAYEERGLL